MKEVDMVDKSYNLPEGSFDVNDELDKARDFYRNHAIPADLLKQMDQQTQELIEQDVIKNVPPVGATAPTFSLPDAKGNIVVLSELLKGGPVVMSFYRGGWCPYCNIALRSLQQALPDFNKVGAHLVAISPQTPDNSLSTAEKNALDFEVLSDADAVVAGDYGLAFEIPKYLQDIYEAFGHPLPNFNGQGVHKIPVPATFIVDQDQVVQYRFANVDYSLRADPNEVMDVLKGLPNG
jgi:peroxiredoxin